MRKNIIDHSLKEEPNLDDYLFDIIMIEVIAISLERTKKQGNKIIS